jgi:hypothetical protein
MKTRVIEYIEQNGLQALADNFHIKIKDYEDRVVLNYDQIESPRYNPIVDECRSLILWKPRNEKQEWRIAAWSFCRFYNVGEDPKTDEFPVQSPQTRIEQKIDGSIISLYWDEYNDRWQPASRSCAFAEGETNLGNTFSYIFWQALQGTQVIEWLTHDPFFSKQAKNYTWVFELCSMETRIVTPFSESKVFLTAGRHKETGEEIDGNMLDGIAEAMKVSRPIRFKFDSLQNAIEKVNSLPAMEEGFVLVYEGAGFFWRLKLKNTKYLAIAHMRENGRISPKRILTLIMANDHLEFLSYFPEDKPYFLFLEEEIESIRAKIKSNWELHKDIVSQKEFAIAVIKCSQSPLESGVLFTARKQSADPLQVLISIEPKKIVESYNIKEKMMKKFHVCVDEAEQV